MYIYVYYMYIVYDQICIEKNNIQHHALHYQKEKFVCFSHNKLTSLEAGALEHSPLLASLNLAHNRLVSIPPEAFVGANSLAKERLVHLPALRNDDILVHLSFSVPLILMKFDIKCMYV